MGFWIRNGIFGLLLAGLAYWFLANQDFLLSLGEEGQKPTEVVEETVTPDKKPAATAAATEEKYKARTKPKNNVVFLPDPKGDLTKILQARQMVVRPYRKNWQGSTESRPFRKGQTLNQKLTEYAQKDGLEIIWWLNRDFVIKDPFRIEKNIIKTSYQIGNAVAGHFPEGISVYFCYRQRAIVLISDPMDYLNDECTLLGANKSY